MRAWKDQDPMANDANPRTFDRVSGPEPRRRQVQTALHQLIQNLESMRQELHRRVNDLEAKAREAAPPDGPSEREQALERRVKELEESQRRLSGQAASWEGEKERLFAQVDEDRAKLAEAWERLEQERIHLSGSAAKGPAALVPAVAQNGSAGHPAAAAPPAAPAAVVPPAPATSFPNDLAKAQVIRIFKTVMDDVRRNS
jgi:peptidoglycan hydrolase CwlO-like protein